LKNLKLLKVNFWVFVEFKKKILFLGKIWATYFERLLARFKTILCAKNAPNIRGVGAVFNPPNTPLAGVWF